MKESEKYLPEGYDVVIARSVQELETIRDIWEKMQKHYNSDIDYFITIINSLSRVIRPHVILLKKNEVPLALAVGRIENFEFKCDFGYKTIYKTIIRTFVLIHGGILGDASPATCKILLAQFIDLMKQGEADLIFLSNIKSGSSLNDLSTRIPGYFFRDRGTIPNSHWRMSLPYDMDAFFKTLSGKRRHELRRYIRVLEKTFPGNVVTKCFMVEKDLNQVFNEVDSIAKKTYQRGLGAGFNDNEVTRRTYSLFAKKSMLRAYLLYIEGKPSAFWVGHQYGNTFHLGVTGYDPTLKKLQIGTVLFLEMIDDLCSSKELKFVDFGFGDAAYKRRYCDQIWNETSVYIFPRSMRGIILNIGRTVTSLMYQFFVLMLKRVNALEKVKKNWRSILTKKTIGKTDSVKLKPKSKS